MNRRWQGRPFFLWLGLLGVGLTIHLPLSAQQTTPRRTLEGHTGGITSLAFSPDAKMLASAAAITKSGKDTSVRLWVVATGMERALLEGHVNGVNSVAFSPDGKILASGSNDRTIKLWDGINGKPLTTLRGHPASIYPVAFSPDGNTLASGSSDNTMVLSIPPEARVLPSGLNTMECTPVPVCPAKVAVSLPVATSHSLIRLWDAATGKRLATWAGAHKFGVVCVAFSPDGKTLASGGVDRSGKTGKGKPDGDIKLWEVATGKNIATWPGHHRSVFAVAFSPDGKTLASGSQDTTVRLWDLRTGKNTATFQGHTDFVRCVAFSPDGRMLASGSHDKTIKLWEVPPRR